MPRPCPWLLGRGWPADVALEAMPADWPPTLLQAINHWCDRQLSLFVFGPSGRGKTRLTTQLALEWTYLYPKLGVMYLPISDYLEHCEQHKHDTFAKTPRWDLAIEVPMLVIDDLGAASERNLPSIRERIAELFFRRHRDRDRKHLWTVTCSVMEPEQVQARYGPEVLSRLGTQFGEFARRDAQGEYVWPDRRMR